MLKEGDVVGTPPTVVCGDCEVTSVEVVVPVAAISFLVPTVVSGELGAGMVPEVVRCVLLTLEWDEVVVSPEWDVV